MEVRTIPKNTLTGLREPVANGDIDGNSYQITNLILPVSGSGLRPGVTVEFDSDKYLITWEAIILEVYEHHKMEVAGEGSA